MRPFRFRVSRWCYRVLLYAYPRPFRTRFREDMERDFLDTLSRLADRRSWVGRWAAWRFAVGDLLRSVPREHLRRRRRAGRSPRGRVSRRESILDRERLSMLDRLWSDIRFTTRSLIRAPGFALVAIVTLALGIGANTAIFSVVNAVLLRPLPYETPEQLALLTHRLTASDIEGAALSGPDYIDYAEQADLFDGLIATFATNTNITGDQGADGIVLSWVTPNFFPILGVNTVVGRGFTPDDRIAIDPNVFNDPTAVPPPLPGVISYGLWQRRYGGDPDVIGRTIQVNGQTMEILGVAPPGFRLYLPVDAAMPTTIDAWTLWPFELRNMPPGPTGFVTAIGRLAPDVTLNQARSQVATIASRLREEHGTHERAGVEAELVPIQAQVVAHVQSGLVVLLGAVGLVLLIACANVANLLLVRASSREKEIAIRTALGAGRGTVVRQMLTESVILALLGAGVGLVFAWLGIDLLLALEPENLPRVEQVGLDGSVLAFTLGVSVLAAVLFGLAPVGQAFRLPVSGVLHERSVAGSRRKQRMRSVLIVLEVAMSVVLLVGAGLMVRSFSLLTRVRPGFEPERVLTFQLTLPVFAYRTGTQRTDLLQRAADRIAELPGVEAVGGVYPLPLADDARPSTGRYALSAGDDAEWEQNEADFRSIVPGVFEAMGVRLRAGRTFTARDNAPDTELTVIVDAKLAERAWGGDDPVGKRLIIPTQNSLTPADGLPARVVGVVDHVRFSDLSRDGRETVYVPHRFRPGDLMNMTLKTAGDPAALIAPVRRIMRELDPDLPVLDVRPMREYVSDNLGPTRFTLVLLGIFSVVALALALVGLYGVISYTIGQRNHEIGVRIALGATRGRILTLVMKQGLALAVVGVGFGLVAAAVVNDLLASLLYEITGTDPVTYTGIAVLLVAVAALACYVPARHAASVHPAVALRSD